MTCGQVLGHGRSPAGGSPAWRLPPGDLWPSGLATPGVLKPTTGWAVGVLAGIWPVAASIAAENSDGDWDMAASMGMAMVKPSARATATVSAMIVPRVAACPHGSPVPPAW